MMVAKEILVSDVERGRRHRKDLGDIDGLAKSIEEIGLLHPIVVTRELKLIAGERRLEAFKKLKRDKIPARLIDIKAISLGELAENYHRKDFAPSEMVAIGEAVEAWHQKQAKEAQIAAGERGKEGGRGNKKEEVAKLAGLLGPTRPNPNDGLLIPNPKNDYSKMRNPSTKLVEGFQPYQRKTAARTAAAVGTSHATYEKAKCRLS